MSKPKKNNNKTISNAKKDSLSCSTRNEEKPEERMETTMECSKYIYDLVNGWIENADNKVSVSMAVLSGIYAAFAFVAAKFQGKSGLALIYMKWIHDGLFALSLVLMGVAVLYYVLAIKPNLKSSGKKKEIKRCPIFFGDISSIDVDGYRILMKNVTKKQFVDELITEIHCNSQICTKKMKNYQTAILLSLAAYILLVLSSIAYYFMQ